jgi:transposase
VLEEANVKLSSAITDVLGMSGRRILKAIVAGETDPAKLAGLGGSRLAASRCDLADALHGRVREHHRFLIDQHLKTIEQLEATIAAFDARIEAALRPFRDAIERLKEIPGLSQTSARSSSPRSAPTWTNSRQPAISCPGPAWFHVSTRVPASAARPA